MNKLIRPQSLYTEKNEKNKNRQVIKIKNLIKPLNFIQMTSINKRKQLVNQLRKAHFPFGFQPNNEKSQYSTKYPEYKISGYQQPNGNARRNNFSIGNENDIDNAAYKSEFKEKFPDHRVKGKQEAIGAKNVGMNNIVFGYDKEESYQTNYKDQFDKKNSENNRVRPGDLKKKNIDFGDTLTDFSTTYGKVFDKKNAPLQQNNGNTQLEKTQTRKSHLMLGNDNRSFQTSNSTAYRQYNANNSHIHKQSNTSNIDLGSDGINYASECKERFALNSQPERHVVGQQVIRDFRSAHFQFAFPDQKVNNQSQAQQQYNQKPIEVNHVNGRKQSNIKLDVDGKAYYESCYNKQFANWGTQPKAEINKHGRKDNILIGTDVDPSERYISQAKNNFGQKPINRVQAIKAQQSLQLGQTANDYLTHNQLTYDNKFPHLQNTKLSQQDITKMKAINVVTGFQGTNYNLHSNQYGRKQGQRGQLSRQTLNKMKNTNIVLQTVPTTGLEGKTSYKDAYLYKINNQF